MSSRGLNSARRYGGLGCPPGRIAGASPVADTCARNERSDIGRQATQGASRVCSRKETLHYRNEWGTLLRSKSIDGTCINV